MMQMKKFLVCFSLVVIVVLLGSCASTRGPKGDKGDKGDPGLGIASAYIDEQNHLVLKMSDNSIIDAGYVGIQPQSATLKLVIGEGSLPDGIPSEITITTGDNILLPIPTLDGYIFEGWYTDGGISPVESPYKVHGNITLYGKWKNKPILKGKAIYTIDDLASVNNDLGGTYILMNDIDCDGLAIPAIGESEKNPFRGVFDGNGHIIYNFVSSVNQYVGIFGYNTGIIRNLGTSDFNLEIASSNVDLYVGGIVGYNSGTVEKCFVKNGKIDITAESARHPGLITGYNKGIIENCFAEGTVNGGYCYDIRVGGIAAINGGTIKNCYANTLVEGFSSGTVSLHHISGTAEIGGIVGINEGTGTIENCLIFGTIKGNRGEGDIVDVNYGTVSNCYRDANLAMDGTNNHSSPMTRQQLTNSTFYRVTLGWDQTIWDYENIDLDNGFFPTLK